MSRSDHVLITGATGQLGVALADRMAGKADRLSLCALEQDALVALRQRLERKHHVAVSTWALDVRDQATVSAWVDNAHAVAPIDWVIMNAGIGGQIANGSLMEEPERAVDLVGANLIGVLNTLHAALPLMRQQRRGRLVMISSLSALIGFDKAPVYAATKAALKVLALSLRPALTAEGISITVVCPGFLAQPMQNGHHGWRPFAVGAEAAARKIVDAAERGAAQRHFPLAMTALLRVLSLMPVPLREATYRRLTGST